MRLLRRAALLFPEAISWDTISVIGYLNWRLDHREHLLENLGVVHVRENVRVVRLGLDHKVRERVMAVVSWQVVTLLPWIDVQPK